VTAKKPARRIIIEAVGCPLRCGVSFAGAPAQVKRELADHKRKVHGQR
jgi:hypothetical protein